MMRDLKQRFGSLDALDAPDVWTEAERRSPGSVTSPLERPGRRWLAVAVAFAVAVAGIGLAVWAFRPPSSRPTPAASPVQNGQLAFSLGTAIDTVGPDGTGLTSLHTDAVVAAYGPVWSPDGSRIAFYGYPHGGGTCGGGSNYDVYVMNADGSDVRNLTTSPSDVQECFSQTAPRWSPDGSMIAYEGDDGLYVMNADGSGQRKLDEAAGMSGFAWSPDGSGFAYVDRVGLYTTTLAGASPVPLVIGDGSVDSPAWSPDGTLIAFLHSGGVDGHALFVVPADGGEAVQVADLSKLDTVGDLVWSPDSRKLAFDAFDGTSWDIWIASADLSGATDAADITSDPTTDENAPAWAPDGTKIAYERSTVLSTSTDNAGTFDVWTMNPDGTGQTQLTHDVYAMGFDVAWQGIRGPAPLENICLQARTTGDFDGDGTIDEAEFVEVVSGSVACDMGGQVFENLSSQKLKVGFGSGRTLEEPFADCQGGLCAYVFAAADLDGDGRDELAIDVSSGGSTGLVEFYRVDPDGIRPLVLAEPGDPPYVQPGPAILGGGFDSGLQSPVVCRVNDDGTRELVSIHAENVGDSLSGPWELHTTTMALRGEELVVTSTSDSTSSFPGTSGIPSFSGTSPFENGCS